MSESVLPTFVKALKDFFGNGQTTTDFSKEYKALSAQDKTDLYDALQAFGIQCQPPAKTN